MSLDRFWRAGGRHERRPPASPGVPEILARRVTPDLPGRPPATISANLALRLIQLHLVVIYAMAGLAKVQGPSWWNGTAIWKTMATGEFVVLDFTALAAWPLLINLVTHASLALELLYPVLIWVKIVRPLLLAGVMALHLGIAVMSPGLTEFALVMIAANLAFVSGPWLRRLVTGSTQPNVARALRRCLSEMPGVDGPDHGGRPRPCRRPGRFDGRRCRVDVDPRLTRAKTACGRCMSVSSAGRITSGFDAVRSIAALAAALLAAGGDRVFARGRMAGPSCVQLACGHSAARRSLHRRYLRDPLSNGANRGSFPRPRQGSSKRDRDRGKLRRSLTPKKRGRSNMCDTSLDEREDDAESPRRMFLHEPGWGIRIKTGSHREFCYTMVARPGLLPSFAGW